MTRRYSLREDFFHDIRTGMQLYWLGFITADGNIISRKGTYRIQIDLKQSDASHLLKFAADLQSDAPVTGFRGGAQIAIHSKQMVEDLARLGIMERKSLNISPPPEILKAGTRNDWGDDAWPATPYWRGYWDGNGSIFKVNVRGVYSHWGISVSGSLGCIKPFGAWAREVCGSKAVHRYARKDSECWQWSIQGTRKPQLLAKELTHLDPYWSLDRKQRLLEELLALDFSRH